MEQLIDYRIHPTGVIMAHKNTISPAANKICEGSAVEWAYLSNESGKCAISYSNMTLTFFPLIV